MFEAPSKRGCLNAALTVFAVIAGVVFVAAMVVFVDTLTEVAP